MTRIVRACLFLLLASCVLGAANGQNSTSMPVAPVSLQEFLKNQAFDLLRQRRQQVAAIKTPEQIAQRQKTLRSFFQNSLGDLPERTPLNARIVGQKAHDGYRVERVIFESRPDHHVTAVLYLPDGKGPFPGVLVPCGHSANGKAYDSYQRICISLAKNGIGAFCFDPIGQGERIQKLDEQGMPAVKEGSTTEHTMSGVGALLVGRQAASYRIWDAMRALDYLAGRPEIDPKRLGCTGNSGGGTETAYLMAIDDRVAVAAPSCYITSLERLFATIGPQDAEQNITGQVAAGLDHADYVILRAPKPTMLSVGTRDFFDIQGSWDTFREVKLIYGRLGLGERIDLFESDEPHGFTKPRREATVRWFCRWLLHRDEPITEPDFPVATDQELQCTSTGQVLRDLKGVSVFDLNAQKDQALRPTREAFAQHASRQELRAKIRELLALNGREQKAGKLTVESTTGDDSTRVRSSWLETEPGMRIAVTELVPVKPDLARPILVRLGVAVTGDSPGMAASRLEMLRKVGPGQRDIVAILRGSEPAKVDKKTSWTSEPFVNESFLSLHIGRPLLGQLTLDILSLLEAIRAESSKGAFPGFDLIATGPSAVAALHAAALDEHGLIHSLTLEEFVPTWSGVVQSGLCRGQLASTVPGVLAFYDLPDLAARLEPLPLTIRNPIDSMGKPTGLAELQRDFKSCVQAYGPSGKLSLEAGPTERPH